MEKPSIHNNKILDYFLAEPVREYIEQTYYHRINVQAELDKLVHDEGFMNNMYNHIALFSDHGVIHVRDVARRILDTLDLMHGVHIAPRITYRFLTMKAYGVMTAYFHDIGMVNFTEMGRAVHSEFAAQEIYTVALDKYLDIIWNENCGNLAWRISDLHQRGFFQEDPKTILRECLALVPAHSKSKFAIDVLNNKKVLRDRIIEVLQYDLNYLYYKKQLKKLDIDSTLRNKDPSINREIRSLKRKLLPFKGKEKTPKTQSVLKRLYNDDMTRPYRWLLSKEPEILDFVDDITDTLRALRCADAFRQRGTSFKTSGGYQIFVDQYTGNAVFALTNKHKQMFMLESDVPHAVGESNIANCEYTPEGDLTISFYTGAFKSKSGLDLSVKGVTMIIYDIMCDVIDSLILPKNYRGKNKISKKTPVNIILENAHDNWKYSRLVARELVKIKSSLLKRIKYTTPLANIPVKEKQRFLNAKTISWNKTQKKQLLKKLAKRGYKTERINIEKCFNDVKKISLANGEVLLESKTPPGFVYITLTDGLAGIPLGGYGSFKIPIYSFIGNSSVIAGTERNATAVARDSIELLMLPQEIYLNYWHDSYSEKELYQALKKAYKLKD